MRITNAMTSNTLLYNLQRNMAELDKLQYQSATGNKIQFASDDPIVAGRALKFRTNLTETNQYLQNCFQAVSWLESTASSVKNMKELLSNGENSIRSRLVAAANGTKTVEDKKVFIAEIKEMLGELTGLANADYAGRYVFSGFRTDEPPTFSKNEANKEFSITQSFKPSDIKNNEIYITDPNDSTKQAQSAFVYSLKLAYDDGMTSVSGLTYTTKNTMTDSGAFTPADDEIYYLEDRGEFIFGKTAYENAVSSGSQIDIKYEKKGFLKGELNPVNYFDCKDLKTGKSYDIGEQFIEYELGSKNQMRINSLSKDVFPVSLLNDLKGIIKLVEQAEPKTEDERKIYNDILGNRLTSLIKNIDVHSENLSKENTLIGTRIMRTNLIENRLKDDRINFEALQIENESVDMEEAFIRLNTQTNIYSSALQVGARLAQMSLVNYM